MVSERCDNLRLDQPVLSLNQHHLRRRPADRHSLPIDSIASSRPSASPPRIIGANWNARQSCPDCHHGQLFWSRCGRPRAPLPLAPDPCHSGTHRLGLLVRHPAIPCRPPAVFCQGRQPSADRPTFLPTSANRTAMVVRLPPMARPLAIQRQLVRRDRCYKRPGVVGPFPPSRPATGGGALGRVSSIRMFGGSLARDLPTPPCPCPPDRHGIRGRHDLSRAIPRPAARRRVPGPGTRPRPPRPRAAPPTPRAFCGLLRPLAR
mmetsp:Transcript_36666/g.96724  ORF Transcript_36666/g.96724 Transcript_36666/m.96724 type:complete len:262 (-) Transcript_36666:270-1055(-)